MYAVEHQTYATIRLTATFEPQNELALYKWLDAPLMIVRLPFDNLVVFDEFGGYVPAKCLLYVVTAHTHLCWPDTSLLGA